MSSTLEKAEKGIPSEIWTEIFIYCLPIGPRKPYPKEAPLLLCQVCSVWRNLAISTPELWEELSIKYNITPGGAVSGASQRDSSMLEAWFTRARTRLLSIGLQMEPLCKGNLVDTFSKFLSDASGRFRSLNLHGKNITNFQPFLDHSQDRFEALESLCMKFELDSSTPAIVAFQNAQRLRRLVLDMTPPEIYRIKVPWDQLTHLSIPRNAISSSTFRSILRRCPLLEDGAFSISSMLGERWGRTGGTILHHLTRLSITFQAHCDSTLLNGYTLPVIEHFMLFSSLQPRTISPNWHFGIDTLMEQLRSVKALTLTCNTINLLEPYSPPLPTTSLTFSLFYRHFLFFSLLTYKAENAYCPLPGLEDMHVHIHGTNYPEFTQKCIELILSRSQNRQQLKDGKIAPLRRLQLLFFDHPNSAHNIRVALSFIPLEGIEVTISEVLDGRCSCSLSSNETSC